MRIYRIEFFAIKALGLSPGQFWKMPVDEFYALCYWTENQGEAPMTLDELKELKEKVGRK